MATRHLFVDESGDLTLFDKRGKSIIGTEGVSRIFMLGFVDITDPDKLRSDFHELRASMLQSAYFSSVPSFDPRRKKTALGFHAKDDIPEVRKEVFDLIKKHDMKAQIAIRRKSVLVDNALLAFSLGYKISQDRLYNELITRLFREYLHKADLTQITFSQRGNKDRNNAYESALNQAKRNFFNRTGITNSSQIVISNQSSFSDPCLQVIDYLLWSVYRFFERNETRYFDYIIDKFSLIKDIDDTRISATGEYYNRRNMISLEKIMPLNS